MNKVVLMGRLTRDPEVRYSQSDNSIAIARFTLAVDRRHRKEEQQSADFISCVAFGKKAEFLQSYGAKGIKFIVEGRIQTGNFVNKDGVKVYTTDIIVENIEFAESKKTNENIGRANYQSWNNCREISDDFMDIPDEADDGLSF